MSVAGAARGSIRWVLRRFGVDVIRYDALRFLHLRRAQLLRERDIDVVLDVGANDGSFARSLRGAGYSGRIHSFEPLSTAFAALASASGGDPGWQSHRVALGSSEGEATLNVADNSSSSSLLAMAPQHLASAPESRFVRSETVPTATLDGLRVTLVTPGERVYLKVDVQGFELEVLRGAEHLLEQVEVVDVELSFVPLYEGAPLAAEVMEHLTRRGFALLDLQPVFVDPTDDRLLQADAVFARWANDASVSSPG
jgi:FkbM family methyltransferase